MLTVADSMRMVRARGGLLLRPHFDITNHPHLDVLVIPDGMVASELQREAVTAWIARTTSTATITASVWTGAAQSGAKPATPRSALRASER